SIRPEIPAALEGVIDRSLEKSPGARFASAGEFLLALRGVDATTPPLRASSARAIAVLPFADISQEKDNAYFSDGLTEEIISRLSRLETIMIVSRSSVMQYDWSGKPTRQIAGDLHVQYLLEGSVRKHGPALRITTHLVDAEKDVTLWSSTYDGTMDEVFDIQEDVARRIVKALRVRLTPDDRRTLNRRATENADAYQVYLKARFSWAQRTAEGLRESIVRFEEAIARDPHFAPAWAGIADACILLTDYEEGSRHDLYARARAAVRCALAIDARLAEAHTSRALLGMLNEWDWEGAKREFRLAIAGSPNYATAHHWYGELLSMLGDYDGAVAEFARALELDPLSPAVHKDRGLIDYYGRQYDGAIRWARRTLTLSPAFVLAHRILSLACQAKGDFDGALSEHRLWAAGNEQGLAESAALAQCLAAAGRAAEARDILGRFPPRGETGGNLARGIALVHVSLGDTETAFDWLERAFEEKAESLGMMKVDPKLDALRGDPRFSRLMDRVGLPR
ncbi:MAG TPA: tetratricopeptide repeat protein, partial [Bacteroidota bacterium]|nr:tetratricopeptide repeat protein [Bacteroidota bacterium]